MNDTCSKCSGKGRVMVQDEGTHWHWEACSDCNGFEEMSSAVSSIPPWTGATDAELNSDLFDNLPW